MAGKLDGFSDAQARSLADIVSKLENAIEALRAPDRVLDRRKTSVVTPIRPRPGDVVRAAANDVVVLPHPRPAKGRQPVVVLVEGAPVDVLAESGTVNDQASVTVSTVGAMQWFSTGTEWWGSAVGGSGGAGSPLVNVQENGVSLGEADTINTSGTLRSALVGGVYTITAAPKDHAIMLTSPGTQTLTLPADFVSGDSVSIRLDTGPAGDYIIDEILLDGGVTPPAGSGILLYLGLTNIVAGQALILQPNTFTTTDDAGVVSLGGPAGSAAADHPYRMASEEEAALLVYGGSPNKWRMKFGSAPAAVTGHVTIPGGDSSVRTATIPSGTLTADMLDDDPNLDGIYGTFIIRAQFAATGAAGTLVDRVIIPVNTYGRGLQVNFAMMRISTAGGTDATLRTATGGGGSILLEDAASAGRTFPSNTTGLKLDNGTVNPNVSANAGVWLRVDRSVVARVYLNCKWIT